MATKFKNPQVLAQGLAVTFNTQDGQDTPANLADATEYEVPNNGQTWLIVRNGGTAANVTLHTALPSRDGLEYPDKTFAVAANTDVVVFPKDKDLYGDPFIFEIDDVTDVSVAVLTL